MRFGCYCTLMTPQTIISAWAYCPGGASWGLLLTRVGFLPPQYVGSFMVEELDLQQRAGWLEKQLRALKVGIYRCSSRWETQGTSSNRGTRLGAETRPPVPHLSRTGLSQEEVGVAAVQLAGAEGLRC